ncbi:hypothetical protein [Trujillonella endophytica]|uniref:Uncharacterized protein n=1 Tax=Trujillonella endophytica TaxID=673521 RepID=A0A1H8VBA6_9ACTN|nr:hypothetical protein [Trujillella endophytica]SEP12593.1 hypothetical protein SAMN05660991_03405 [Trujillella endophytica]
MSGPQDRDRDGFDDRDGSGWREPEHLGDGSAQGGGTPPPADPPQDPPAGDRGWQPPGWDLPAAEPDRSREAGHRPWQQERPGPAAPPQDESPGGGGPFAPRPPRRPGEFEQVFAYQGDPVGAQGWALQQGWEISDGTGPGDAGLAVLLATAPTRLTRDHRPAGVMRGRYGALDLVAFDVVYADKRRVVPEYAVTAAPVLATLPGLRLSPARFWKHRTGGLVPVPSGDPEFDARWVLLAEADTPVVRRLVEDPTVRGLLLGSDDGDEFWSAPAGAGGDLAGGYVAAIRPDGHRPQLIEHHARLLTAVVGALAAAS